MQTLGPLGSVKLFDPYQHEAQTLNGNDVDDDDVYF